MQQPPHLKQGDKVMLIATARKIAKKEIEPAIKALENWGLEVAFSENLLGNQHQFSGTTAQRATDLQTALDDKNIKAIICVRGGYGTVKIIDEIDFSCFVQEPKWVVGYSDVTVLHNHINQNFKIQTLHATMPINFPNNTKESLDSLKNALFGQPITYHFNPHPFNRNGTGSGKVVGGNLSIIYSLTGTPSQLNTKGCILFLEDLDEYIYHIDRMMLNLKRAGMLAELSGLVVGGMSDMNDNAIPYGKSAQAIILEVVEDYHYPVCFNFPAGHLNNNKSLVMGGDAVLNIGNRCVLKFL